jgi:hypothetical protein
MSDTCPTCSRPVKIDRRFCKFCTADVGFPNVRYARRPDELLALKRRVTNAKRVIKRKGTTAEHMRFTAIINASKLVINRNVRQLAAWLARDNKLYLNFYKLKRLDENFQEDKWNYQRISAENAVNPLFFEDLSIAAITADDVGMSYYGECSIFIREDTIASRTTVFEENPFSFNVKHGVIAGAMPPAGYRATWADRATLATAKLGAKLHPSASDGDLAELIMARLRGAANCDFIEAHVYGDIHAECIEKVVCVKPKTKADRLIWRDQRSRLSLMGIDVKEIV